MKRLTLLLLVFIIGITACEGPTGPMGPQGPSGKDGDSNWYVPDDIEIKSDMWKLMYDENDYPYYECRVSRLPYFREVTQPEFEFIFDKGLIICYLVDWISYDGGAQILAQFPLPHSVYFEDNVSLYSESISFEVLRTGHINFTVRYSDFAPIKPGDRVFHVVMKW